MALPAFAAARRATAPCCTAVAAPVVQQLTDISYPPGPQQQTRRTLLHGQTDGWTLYRFIDAAPHTMRAAPLTL